jgi:hypothetical protein
MYRGSEGAQVHALPVPHTPRIPSTEVPESCTAGARAVRGRVAFPAPPHSTTCYGSVRFCRRLACHWGHWAGRRPSHHCHKGVSNRPFNAHGPSCLITSYRRVQEPDTDIPRRKPLYGLLYWLKQGPNLAKTFVARRALRTCSLAPPSSAPRADGTIFALVGGRRPPKSLSSASRRRVLPKAWRLMGRQRLCCLPPLTL